MQITFKNKAQTPLWIFPSSKNAPGFSGFFPITRDFRFSKPAQNVVLEQHFRKNPKCAAARTENVAKTIGNQSKTRDPAPKRIHATQRGASFVVKTKAKCNFFVPPKLLFHFAFDFTTKLATRHSAAQRGTSFVVKTKAKCNFSVFAKLFRRKCAKTLGPSAHSAYHRLCTAPVGPTRVLSTSWLGDSTPAAGPRATRMPRARTPHPGAGTPHAPARATRVPRAT